MRVTVRHPAGWVEAADTRFMGFYSGIPFDRLPDPLQAIHGLSVEEGMLEALVDASSPIEAFWCLVDYARYLSLPVPALWRLSMLYPQ